MKRVHKQELSLRQGLTPTGGNGTGGTLHTDGDLTDMAGSNLDDTLMSDVKGSEMELDLYSKIKILKAERQRIDDDIVALEKASSVMRR